MHDAVHLVVPQPKAHIARPDSLPPTPVALKQNNRWLQVTVLNQTRFRLQYIDTYFTSGEYHTRPSDAAPQSTMTFGAFSNERMAGCGGTRFRVHFEDGTYRDFAIGWVNPPLGRHKAGAVFDRSPRVACEGASPSGDVVASEWEWQQNADGESVAFKLKLSAKPGSSPVYLVEEVAVVLP